MHSVLVSTDYKQPLPGNPCRKPYVIETLTHEGIVIFAAGMKTNLDLVKSSSIELGRDGIIVNNRMETSLKDVYAAGNCTQHVSGITGIIDLLTFAIQKQSVLSDLIDLSYSSQPYQSFFPAANSVVLAADDALKNFG